MDLTLDGVVLSSKLSKESDALLTLLTPNGTVSVFVKGIAKTKKNRLHAQLFTFSTFELKKGTNGMLIVAGAEVKQAFYGLRSDLLRLASGQYFLEVSKLVRENSDGAEGFFRLLLNSLYLLSEKPELKPEIVKLVFEIKFAQLSGYLPESGQCVECGKNAAYWDFDNGFLCSHCAEKQLGEDNSYPLSPAMVSALCHILKEDGLRAYCFEMSEDAFSALAALSQKHIEYKTEQHFKTTEFFSD